MEAAETSRDGHCTAPRVALYRNLRASRKSSRRPDASRFVLGRFGGFTPRQSSRNSCGYSSWSKATCTGERMAKSKRGRSTAVIDDHVGRRIRERRILLGLTQGELAEMIGVTYQQAHKYEHGINRVSAGRLFEIARVLSAPITYFYEGIGQEGPRQITPRQGMLIEITRNFAEIRNEKHQEAVSHLARVLSSR
jgi:transcriptional regulator with XRE-family HTH domain